MDINFVMKGEISIIKINGRLDATTAPIADKSIKKLLKKDYLRLIFDLSTLEYLSSGGLKVILGTAKELKHRRGKFVLCSLSKFVKEIFETSGINSLIPITDSVESGIRQLG